MPRLPAGPQHVGRFELLRRLGVGGMGEVWIARAPGEPLVAIKRMLPNLAHDARAAQMFLDEARIASQLDHPNVVRILEVDHDEDVQWFAMELVMGENVGKLAERARKQRQPIAAPIAARIIKEAAGGVHHAHTRTDARGRPLGIIHRDVTPPNIMVTDDGQVKVLDFGIAKAVDRVARTEAGAFKGKVEYLSPEQILGAELDHRTDIFALGSVLFELLTGKKLFARSSMVATLAAITDCRVPPPSKVTAGVPAELDAIVLGALSRDPAARYATAAAFSEALARYLRAARPPADLLARWIGGLCPEEQAERRRLVAPAVRRAESLVEGPALAEVLERAFEDHSFDGDDDAPYLDFAAGSEAPTQLSRMRPEVSEAVDPIFGVDPRAVSTDGRLELELSGATTEDPAPVRALARPRPPPPPPPLTLSAAPAEAVDLEATETGTPAEATPAPRPSLPSLVPPRAPPSAPPGPSLGAPPGPSLGALQRALDDDDDDALAGGRPLSRWALAIGFGALTLAGAVAGGAVVYRARAPEEAPVVEPAARGTPAPGVTRGAGVTPAAPGEASTATGARTLAAVAIPTEPAELAAGARTADAGVGDAAEAAAAGDAAAPDAARLLSDTGVRSARREAARTSTRTQRRRRAPQPIGPDDVEIEYE